MKSPSVLAEDGTKHVLKGCWLGPHHQAIPFGTKIPGSLSLSLICICSSKFFLLAYQVLSSLTSIHKIQLLTFLALAWQLLPSSLLLYYPSFSICSSKPFWHQDACFSAIYPAFVKHQRTLVAPGL